MSAAAWWLVVAGAVVVGELLTGSVYLLMVALGLAAAALAAYLGFDLAWQFVALAVVGAAATGAWHTRVKKRQAGAPAAEANPDVNIDVGETVNVAEWKTDGSAEVRYRGAAWQARLASASASSAAPGNYRIARVQGNVLMLEAA
jgi:membrane protein implicated in regulation of membrane protease activity